MWLVFSNVKRFVLSIQHGLNITLSSLCSQVRRLATRLVIAFLLMLSVSMLLPSTVLAAEAGLLGISGGSEETARAPIPDSFGRDTPRQTVQGFIRALGENDYLLASNYLNLSKADNPTTIVRQFKQALDTGGRFQPDLQISNIAEGNLSDQLPASQENVGVININDKSVPLILERVVSDTGEQYWQFSNDTLSAIPEVIENTEPTLVNRYTFEALDGESLFGYELTDLAAAIVLTIGSFILTYLFVWLLYHFLRVLYPRVRHTPLPLPDKIILPLAVVIMALMLSEIMVYAGISVTLREPINRFTDIASWVALTWLLMRLVDVISTQAVNLSYRKNYIERVSILGLLRKVVKAMLLIFAVIVIFGNLGFDLTTGIAALGVGGLALALGAQKTIENLVGSVVVVADTPVRIGDYCKFGTQEGTVIDIGIRSSRVRTLNRTVVTVPNGDFSSMQIENYTSRDMFHFLHNLYIKRSADIEVIFAMVKDLDTLLNEHELTNQEWNQANILALRQDCYVIQLRCYVNSVDIIEFYGKQDILLVDILTRVKQYKVEHALPTQQLVINRGEVGDTLGGGDNPENTHSPVIDERSIASDNGMASDAVMDLAVDVDKSRDNLTHPRVDDTGAPVTDKGKNHQHKSKRMSSLRLAKRTFKRVKKQTHFSIWNQPWD